MLDGFLRSPASGIAPCVLNESAPSVARALDWVPSFVVGMGIAAWSSDNLPHPVAIALIVIGILAGVIGQKLSPAHKEDQ